MKSIYDFVPNEIKENGYTKEIMQNILSQLYIKKSIETVIEKVQYDPIQLVTLEGLVLAMPGMYAATGVHGEKYVIDSEILETSYDKVLGKENVYVKKKYPVIVEPKKDSFVVPCQNANGGVLKGKAGDYLIQSMICPKNIYPIDSQIFEETYIPYIEYLREKYASVDEQFEEEVIDNREEEVNIFFRFINFIKKIFHKK